MLAALPEVSNPKQTATGIAAPPPRRGFAAAAFGAEGFLKTGKDLSSGDYTGSGRSLGTLPAPAAINMSLFDPSKSIEFDLARGQVKHSGVVPTVLVPAEALGRLVAGAGSAERSAFASELGKELGSRASQGLRDPGTASVQQVAEQLGGQLALMGFGQLGIERWGKALVLSVRSVPWPQQVAPLLVGVLAEALKQVFDRELDVVQLQAETDAVRLLVVAPTAAATVKRWLAEELSWGQVLERLHLGGAEGGAS